METEKMETKKINLGIHKIIIDLILPLYKENSMYSSGSITSNLKRVCECGDPSCEFNCEQALEAASDRNFEQQQLNNEVLAKNRRYNHVIDTLTDLILAHAIEGIDVESLAYLKGIEVAEQAISGKF